MDAGGKPSRTLSPTATLSEFFDQWYLPVILKPKDVSRATVLLWQDSVNWWVLLTNDPPMKRISDQLAAAFVCELKKAKWRRGVNGVPNNLAPTTIKRHVLHVKALLSRAAAKSSDSRPGAGLIERVPAVPLVKAWYQMRPAFSLEEARLIAAGCATMQQPPVPKRLSAAQWWRARIGLLYYTGLRKSTVCLLRWRHYVRDASGQHWLDVPGELTKTKKAIRLAVHPQLAAVLRPLRSGASDDHLLTPEACSMSHFDRLHAGLQERVGIANAIAPSVWRRTHAQQLAELGLAAAEEVARIGLDHSSVRVTQASYVTLVDRCRLRLPRLWDFDDFDERQLQLF